MVKADFHSDARIWDVVYNDKRSNEIKEIKLN